jgi:phage protein D
MSESWVPEYKVKLDGKELPQADDLHLQKITVDLRRQAPASCELQFNNHSGEYSQREDLGPGTVVQVMLGYTTKTPEVVFEGEIIGSRARSAENGPRVFVVRAYDALHKLTRGRKTRTFLDQKFSDILRQVAGDWGLSPDVEDTKFVREYVIEHNQTDLDFTRGIAGWIDYDLHIRHREGPKKLRFKAPEVGASAGIKAVYEKPDLPAGDLYLRRFDGQQSLSRVVSEVVVRGWSPGDKRELVGKASGADLYSKMGGSSSAIDELIKRWGETERQVVDYKVFTQDEADSIAKTKLNEYARTFLKAEIELQGDARPHPGAIMDVSLVGPRFDGPYFVERVIHTFQSPVGQQGGFTTRVQASRCAW